MKINRNQIIWIAIAIIVLVCVYLIITLGYWFYGKNRVYPKVTVAGISIFNLSDEEAEKIIKNKVDNYISNGIYVANKKIDTEKLSIKYDISESIKNAKSETSKNPFLLGKKLDYALVVSYDEKYLYDYIKSLEKEYNKIPKNPSVNIENGELIIMGGEDGRQINYSETVYDFTNSLNYLNQKTQLSLIKIPQTFLRKDLELKKDKIESMFSNDLTLLYPDGKIKVPITEMLAWIQLQNKQSPECEIFASDKYLKPFYERESESSLLSINSIESYLSDVSNDLDTEPVNAVLSIKDGKVAVFEESKNGREMDIKKSALSIKESLERGESKAELSFNFIKPDVYLGSINDLGIKELVSTGYSNFSGSPTNRRHNIRVGAEKFNGLLIKPGDTFSFTAHLGEVDASTGYLPELVIKDNETIPEYGGGLCQVSSTAFRAALNAGLPIIARKAHSYPVSYYKPYGTDATVYVPNPDLKFKNDTGAHILIQTRIVGNYLYFDFYGTKKNISVKFAGNKEARGAVSLAEKVTPYTYDFGGRGEGSFKAVIYRFIYDTNNKLVEIKEFFSNYDSPDKYPH